MEVHYTQDLLLLPSKCSHNLKFTFARNYIFGDGCQKWIKCKCKLKCSLDNFRREITCHHNNIIMTEIMRMRIFPNLIAVDVQDELFLVCFRELQIMKINCDQHFSMILKQSILHDQYKIYYLLLNNHVISLYSMRLRQ